MSDELHRAIAEAQKRADEWALKCSAWKAATETATAHAGRLTTELEAAHAEIERLAALCDQLTEEKDAAVATIARALQESHAERDDLSAQLAHAQETIASYVSWWPFDMQGKRVTVCVQDGEASASWSAIFRSAEDAQAWVDRVWDDPDDGRDHGVMVGELQGLRFWNSIEPAPSPGPVPEPEVK